MCEKQTANGKPRTSSQSEAIGSLTYYVIPSEVEGSISETPHHRLTTEHFFQNRNPFVASDISAQGTPIKGALAGESPQGEAEGGVPYG